MSRSDSPEDDDDLGRVARQASMIWHVDTQLDRHDMEDGNIDISAECDQKDSLLKIVSCPDPGTAVLSDRHDATASEGERPGATDWAVCEPRATEWNVAAGTGEVDTSVKEIYSGDWYRSSPVDCDGHNSEEQCSEPGGVDRELWPSHGTTATGTREVIHDDNCATQHSSAAVLRTLQADSGTVRHGPGESDSPAVDIAERAEEGERGQTDEAPPPNKDTCPPSPLASRCAYAVCRTGHSANPKHVVKDRPFPGWTMEVIVRIHGDKSGRSPGTAVPQYIPPGHTAPIRERGRLEEYLALKGLPASMITAFDFMPLFCCCHRQEDHFVYLECSANMGGCGGWFHPPCAGWTDAELKDKSEKLSAVICPLCSIYIMDSPAATGELYRRYVFSQ